MNIHTINFEPELIFKTSRSRGKGGQNVNKVETKVTLNFDVLNSKLLNDEQKEIILTNLKNLISDKGILRITSQSERSQLQNKLKTIEKFYKLIYNCFKKKKRRIRPSIPASVKEKRLKEKKIQSQKKELRRKVNL